MTQIKSDYEVEALEALNSRNDIDALRIKRFLAMPDLSRSKESPIAELVNRILKIPRFSSFNQIQVPEIVSADVSFDLFNFPSEHPARSKSDTYYIDDKNILRTHTTIMWYYYLTQETIKEKIKAKLPLGVVSFGKVYRKDEIDRYHMNFFHQIDGLYLVPDDVQTITQKDLEDVLTEIAQAVFGKDIKCRFNIDQFPYTDPSLEMEIQIGDQWVEVLGGGLAHPVVLKNLGLTGYNGWAFGFGLERLAIVSMDLPDIRLLWSDDPRVTRQLHLGNKFVSVSKYPPITRDISFVVGNDFIPNNYFDLIRDLGADLVEEVQLLDKYENPEKFGSNKISYTYRIIYRSNDRTLVSEEIDAIQDKIYRETARQFQAGLR